MIALILVLAQTAPASPLAASTYAELSATSVEVTGLDVQAKNYIGSQFLAQAGWGPWALAVRARWEGLPGEFKGDQFLTYRSAEAYLSGHLNLFAAEGVTCGPAATVGYAVALEKGRPMLSHDVTAQVGLHCSSGGRTVLVQAGMWQPLPGVSATVAVIWPLSDRVSWQADFGVGARQQQVARVAVAVSIWRKAGIK